MKRINVVFTAFAAILTLGGSLVPATPVNASAKYRRTKIVKAKKVNYVVRNKKGKTYKFRGSAKKLTLKTNHYLKNYTKSTWKRTKQTKVYRQGKKKLVYYYLTTSKHKAAGWVKKSDLKVKRAKKATAVTKTSSSAKVVKQTTTKPTKSTKNKQAAASANAKAESESKKEYYARVGTRGAGGGKMPSVWD
ncbi:hypothetical protein [Levilactobacillus tongjiangensis]|uniref:Surface layer protein A domain-containing protein n=1 Tax=Levilactobacillus tongjiangensis TaxID=2486023 RepID=A0ABW1SUH8_9LACO|nr:hypothetical protein [Levilactobacillus tongjiangensis]